MGPIILIAALISIPALMGPIIFIAAAEERTEERFQSIF